MMAWPRVPGVPMDRLRSALHGLAILLLALVPNLACGGGSSPAPVPAGCGCQAAGAAGVVGSTPPGPQGTMTAAEIALVEEVFAQVNAERMGRGLTALRWHPAASDVAMAHSVHQEAVGDITHDGPGACAAPTDCLDERLSAGGIAPGARSAWGENVARGQATAQDVMCGAISWMLSAPHCANLLEPTFTHIGIAVKTGGVNGPYWTQVFLRIP